MPYLPLANMTSDYEMNVRIFKATLQRTEHAFYEEYSFGTVDSFVSVSLDWDQQGKLIE